MMRHTASARDTSLPGNLLERLRYVELYTARVVRDALIGDYRSRIRGHGFDFDQHKKYQQGDDFRQLDWNVFARTEEAFVKRNFEDKELNTIIVADLSRSMEFTTSDVSKKELLLEVTATLAFSAAMDNIGVGLLAFAERVEEYVPPAKGRKQTWKLLERLWSMRPQTTQTDLKAPLEFLNSQLKKSSLIFLLSDFAGRADILESPYLKMLVRRHDLVPIVIVDRLESFLPGTGGFVRVKDAECDKEIVVRIFRKDQQKYSRLADERMTRLRTSFYRLGLDHLWLRSDQPYLNPVLEFFLNRKRRR